MKTILIAIALAIIGGCSHVPYEELLDTYDAECLGKQKTLECEEMNERLMAMEERRARKQREEEQRRAQQAYCSAAGGVLYCEQRVGEMRCQCASKESIQGILNQL